jgi:hypothetical protein
LLTWRRFFPDLKQLSVSRVVAKVTPFLPHPTLPWQFIDLDSGLCLPYYTSRSLRALLQMDLSQMSVVELGGGRSTLWWRYRAKEVMSFDTSEWWADRFQLRYVTPSEIDATVRAEFRDGTVDVVVIDGEPVEDRDKQIVLALDVLKKCEHSFIIVDNFDQPSLGHDFPQIKAKIKEQGSHIIYGSPLHPDWKTLIFWPYAANPPRLSISEPSP